MARLSDREMNKRLEAIPLDPLYETKFFEDDYIFPGRKYDEITNRVCQPQESLKTYEETLSQIKNVNEARYSAMHKGTPFYIMGWLAYEMKDYEKGVFYIDAALSEDIINFKYEWRTFPAAAFLFLDDTNVRAAARHITIEIKKTVSLLIDKFSKKANVDFDINALINDFIQPNAEDHSYRSIITALLTFILEGQDRSLQLKLRSRHGGTLEPFITHLFKGGLIFESLLKKKYSGSTLGSFLDAAKKHLGLSKKLYRSTGANGKTGSRAYKFSEIPECINRWDSEVFQDRAIAIAYVVRNTAGHDLGWQDVLTEDLYLELYEGIVYAILWTIMKK